MSDDGLSCRRVRGCSPSMAAWSRSQLLNGTHIDRPTLQGEKSSHDTRTNNAKTLRDAGPIQVFTSQQPQDITSQEQLKSSLYYSIKIQVITKAYHQHLKQVLDGKEQQECPLWPDTKNEQECAAYTVILFPIVSTSIVEF